VLNGEPLEILHLPKNNNGFIDLARRFQRVSTSQSKPFDRDPLLSLSDVAFRHL